MTEDDYTLQSLYPDILIPKQIDMPVAAQDNSNPASTHTKIYNPAQDGVSFHGGGINYSGDALGGHVSALIKVNKAQIQWKDDSNSVFFGIKSNGHANLNYQRKF